MVVKYVLLHKVVFYLMELFHHSLEEIQHVCWASQLLVLNLSTTITFEFSNSSSDMEAFEIVMLTCPQENIGAARKVILKFAGNKITTTVSHRS